jgi:hypothetical protein
MAQEQVPPITNISEHSNIDTSYVLSPKERRRLALEEASKIKIDVYIYNN